MEPVVCISVQLLPLRLYQSQKWYLLYILTLSVATLHNVALQELTGGGGDLHGF
jgi:hypothetical protein